MSLLPFTYQKSRVRLPTRIPIEAGWSGGPVYTPSDDWDQETPQAANYPAEIDPALDQQPQQQPIAKPEPAIDPSVIPWRGVSPQSVQQPSTTATLPSAPTPDIAPTDLSPQSSAPTITPASNYTGPSLRNMPAPPVMIGRDKRKRPDEAIGGADETTRQQALLNSVKNYQAQKAHGWRRYLAPMLAGWAAGQRGSGSPYSGLGGAIVGGITGAVNPKWGDEQWQKRKEAEVQSDLNDALEQKKAQAQIANYGSLDEARRASADLREQTQTLREKQFETTARATALRQLNTMDYEPGKDPVVDDHFKSVFGALPAAHKKDEPTQFEWSNGQLLRVPKRMGAQAENVQAGGQNVVDERRQAKPTKVIIGGVEQNMLLTPHEAAIAQQAEANRKQRADLAAKAEKGRNVRHAQSQANAVPPRVHGAISMLGQYRNLGVQAQRAQFNGDNATATKLIQNQRAVGAQLKQMYGGIIEWDEKGQPILKDLGPYIPGKQ